MGGGPLVDGVRRWFHRRTSSSTSSATVPGDGDQQQKSSQLDEENNVELNIDGDFDISCLKRLRVPKRSDPRLCAADPHKQGSVDKVFFTEYGEASRYEIQEIIGKGSYGIVASAVDTRTGEKVAIKKIDDVFEHVSDAMRILREVKLLRMLRHTDVVEIKHIMLPPSSREFKDIYVVFELMESDLHQVIKENYDLTPKHYQILLYQLVRALKYIHSANVFHRDLKPKNVLANADCKLKICDFGLARVSFNDAPSTIFWTDYVATRWYRAPELCGSFFSKYTPAVDIWSVGCIFAEMLMGKPLFAGRNVVHQLDLITNLLGTPPSESIARIRNEKAKRYLNSLKKKQPLPFSQKFPGADPLALRLLERLLAFDPKDRPSAEEALADPYFRGLANVDLEPSTRPISKLEFDFERRKLTKDDVRELIYREILEYHPQMLQQYFQGAEKTTFMYPSGVDRFKSQFAHLEENYTKGERNILLQRKHASLPRERVVTSKDKAVTQNSDIQKTVVSNDADQVPPGLLKTEWNETLGTAAEDPSAVQYVHGKANNSPSSLQKSATISASKCVYAEGNDSEDERTLEHSEATADGLSQKMEAL